MADENTVVETSQQGEPETKVETNVETKVEGTTETPAVKQDGEKPVVRDDTIPIPRFKEVYSEMKNAKREADYLRQELERLRPAQQPQAPQEPSTPKWEDYERQGKSPEQFNIDYMNHVSMANAKRVLQDERQRQAQGQRQYQAEQRLSQAADKLQQSAVEARTQYADFDVSIQAMEDAGITFAEPINIMIAESDAPAHLAYHLAKHPEEAYKISRMPIERAIYELGRITHGVVASKGNTSSVKSSNAPAPVIPVTGNKQGSRDPYSSDASMDDFMTTRRAYKV